MDVQKLKSDSGLKSGNGEVINSLRNFGQAASNNIAETVSMPIDAIAWALRKAGVPNSIVGDKPVMGSDWMAEKGFTRPTQEGLSKMAGDFVGMVSPLALEKNVASQLAGALRNIKPKAGLSTEAVGGMDFLAPKIDEMTGLPLNKDGTVTVYHHTNKDAANQIKSTGRLQSAGEPSVYVTTHKATDTGYGDHAVPLNIKPSLLNLDDEFPGGRMDFSIDVGRPRGAIPVKVGDF
jgi:hypothetical protein